MKQFLFETEFADFEENHAISLEMEDAIKEIEEMFINAEAVKPAEGFTNRFLEKLALQKKKEYRKQIVGLLGFNVAFIVLIAGFLFMNFNVEVPTFIAGLEIFFDQFFVLLDSILKIRVLLSTFVDIVPITMMVTVMVFFSFTMWLAFVMVRQHMNRPVLDERVN